MKDLSRSDLKVLAEEIRKFIIDVVSETGGHLASNLGVVELTVALHYIFDVPKDKIVWDVGHQSYAHKLLTGLVSHPSAASGHRRIYPYQRKPLRRIYHRTQQHIHIRQSGHCYG